MDYKFLMLYMEKIRNFNDSDILFTSLKPPYSPLSYSSINAIFKVIERVFRTLHPIYFDDINIIMVPKKLSKTRVVHSKDAILVDDYSGNLKEWEDNGGVAVRFSKDLDSHGFKVINKLDQLMVQSNFHD